MIQALIHCYTYSITLPSDLFDDEGFSLCDINRTLLGEDAIQQQDSAYFLDDGSCDSDDDSAIMKREKKGISSNGVGDGVSMDDDTVDLQRARVSHV